MNSSIEQYPITTCLIDDVHALGTMDGMREIRVPIMASTNNILLSSGQSDWCTEKIILIRLTFRRTCE